MNGSSLAQVISGGTAWTGLARPQFGHDWEARFVVAVLLAAALVRFNRKAGWRLAGGFVAAALAMGFLGTLAWSGHGGAAPGLRGEVPVAGGVLDLLPGGGLVGGVGSPPARPC